MLSENEVVAEMEMASWGVFNRKGAKAQRSQRWLVGEFLTGKAQRRRGRRDGDGLLGRFNRGLVLSENEAGADLC